MDRLLIWFWDRFRPREGWLLFGLTLFILWLSADSVVAAEWVPDSRPIWTTFIVTIFVTYLIIWRNHIRPVIHICLLGCSIFVAAITGLIKLRFRTLFFDGLQLFGQELELGLATYWARLSGWLQTISNGESSNETAIFALALALVMGVSVAVFIWQVYRKKQPVIMIFSLLFLLGLNSYFSGSRNANILIIIMFGIIYMVMWEHVNRESYWKQNKIDSSDDMLMTTTFVTAGIVFVLLFSSVFLPSLPYSEAARRFQQSAMVKRFEERFEQVFAGVNTAANRPGTDGPPVAGGAQSPVGILPRQYLLGNAPELAETPVFLAELTFSQPPMGPLHWRASSFDIYTGRGWRQSTEAEILELQTQEQLPSLIPINHRSVQIDVDQTITWLVDGRFSNLLTIGLPTAFNQPVETYLRPFSDLSRVAIPNQRYAPGYQATSRLVLRNPASLNQLTMSQELFENPEFFTHYTSLPTTVPKRVIVLAEQVTDHAQTPFEQALLLEQFLRQYSYNLDIPPVPDHVDPVDYFLFDLQEGYCDLYASSMVVMARSLGLPARLGIGYLHPEPREDGKYVITRDLGHSWAEIYFPEVGWVEFEPTASFPISNDIRPVAQNGTDFSADPQLPGLPEQLPIPENPRNEPPLPPWLWWGLASTFVLVGALIAIIGRARREPKSMAELFTWLQQSAAGVGYQLDDSETVTEFSQKLQAFLQHWVDDSAAQTEIQMLKRHISGLAVGVEVDRYSSSGLSGDRFKQMLIHWRAIKRPMRKLWWLQRWNRLGNGFFK